jgi:hypothetical protein
MIVKYFDKQDRSNPLNASLIQDEAALLQTLDASQGRPPFFCELVGENGFKVLIGLGKSTGSVQHSSIDGKPPYLMAVAEGMDPINECTEYLIGNTPTPVPSRYCLPIETVREIALHFQRTGGRSTAVSWEEI